jgi:RNA polymerase sigma-70 factor (ECF subfamily)
LLQACREYLRKLASQAISEPMRAKCAPSDLVQETALDAHRDFGQFHGERLEALFAWLRKILLDNAASARRRYEQAAKRDLSREISLDGALGLAGQLRDGAPSPRSVLGRIEKQQQVERALDRLPKDQKTAILLRSRDHCSFAEIGEQMQRSADAARKLWFRGIEQLRQELLTLDERT